MKKHFFQQTLEQRFWMNLSNIKKGMKSGQMESYFTNLDFPKIMGFPEISATFLG